MIRNVEKALWGWRGQKITDIKMSSYFICLKCKIQIRGK